MNEFVDKLKQVWQPPPAPLGFLSRAAGARPRIQLVALVESGAPEAVDSADAVIVPEATAATAGKLRGVWLKKGDSAELESAIGAGADFVVLPATGRFVSADKKIGKVLELDASITDVLLRTAGDLPVDAVMLTEGKEADPAVTWRRLMLFQRFAGLAGKPVIVSVAPSATSDELQAVWETGVSGVLVQTSDARLLAELRERIDGLQFPARRRKERVSATLPRIATVAEQTQPEEEPDEDDDN